MILEVNKLRKEVSSGDSKLVILNDVSFNLLEGQSLAITGPSGSGKSTLLGLLAGLDTATSGEIYLNGEALHELDEEQRALLRKEKDYKVIITERCIETDRNVFAKMLYDDKKIKEIDYKIYLRCYKSFIKKIPKGFNPQCKKTGCYKLNWYCFGRFGKK